MALGKFFKKEIHETDIYRTEDIASGNKGKAEDQQETQVGSIGAENHSGVYGGSKRERRETLGSSSVRLQKLDCILQGKPMGSRRPVILLALASIIKLLSPSGSSLQSLCPG